VSGTFTTTGSLTSGRESSSATALQDGRVLVAGGDVGINDIASAEIYQP
jgi:hypothetical protein